MKAKIITLKKEPFIILIMLLFKALPLFSQDFTFTFVRYYKNKAEIFAVGDSLKKPLLITENRIYVVGADCIGRLFFDGDVNGRNEDGTSDNRLKNGENDERQKGGGVVDRKKKARNNNRTDDGDVNNRDKDGDSDIRHADGAISQGAGCSIALNGKVLLYTRQKISDKNSHIYYNQKFFGGKYFKIITL